MDSKTGKYRIIGQRECIHVGGPNVAANVAEGKARDRDVDMLIGDMNTFGYGPKKRRYEIAFL